MQKNKTLKIAKMSRHCTVNVRASEPDASGSVRYSMTVSSEHPVERFGALAPRWIEILDHTADAVSFERSEGMPLLLDHDTTAQVGVVETLALTSDRKLAADVRFSRSTRAIEIAGDVADGIRRNVSLGYQVIQYARDGSTDEGVPIFRATKWIPLETSIVSVPADPNVGVGRAGDDEYSVEVLNDEDDEKIRENEKTDEEKAAELAAQEAAAAAEAAAKEAESAEKKPDDVEKDEKEAGDAVRAQSAEVVRMLNDAGHSDRAPDFISRGLTTEQAALEILSLRRSTPINQHSFNNNKNTMKEDISKKYSYARAILVGMGEMTGGLEAEVSAELKRHMPESYKSRGISIPVSRSQIRALDSKTAGSGAETVFTEAGDFIEILRNMSVADKLGATFLTNLTSPVGFPKQTGSTTAHWVNENSGTDVDASQIVTGSVSLTPKTLQATTAFSRQLLAQAVSNINIEDLVQTDLAMGHALAIDRAALHGAGTKEPVGIYNAAGVGVIDMAAGVTYGKLIDMIAKALTGNALLGSLGFAVTPQIAGKLAQTLIAEAAGAGHVWNGKLSEGTIAGYIALASNQIASNMGVATDEHGIIFGNWADLLIGTWGVIDLTVDPFSLKKQGLIEVTSFQMADVAIRNGASFVKATNVKL